MFDRDEATLHSFSEGKLISKTSLPVQYRLNEFLAGQHSFAGYLNFREYKMSS